MTPEQYRVYQIFKRPVNWEPSRASLFNGTGKRPRLAGDEHRAWIQVLSHEPKIVAIEPISSFGR
jgi:hypothetical protein